MIKPDKKTETEFQLIYRDHYAQLYLHALKMLKDNEEAKDIVHEVFTRLWLKFTQLPENINIKSYLLVAVRNAVLDRFSKDTVRRKYLSQLDPSDFLYFNDQAEIETELMGIIENEIAQLPEQMRIVFMQSRFHDKSNSQIADELNISINTVKTHISRAIKRLKLKTQHFFSLFI
ncbi:MULTISPECIES: RNA polymerase sigma-70 factor [Sphingobacterium]|jgi:RNA polymerase sigma-70 factor (ECF subfamily)|uniref:RNA polymerase sigma-70 factor n=1 Tax=Sphingobacterium litopenaei TaxID=2763500 RepID=A0ABR7YD36_9SPHI|nr:MULTISPECIES: RNA polymerase sigma-70 factor [Sphingobacterium]MBD1429222.1 RNA polymerase sigma-70 factor [Sphingobacterium litopenaei]